MLRGGVWAGIGSAFAMKSILLESSQKVLDKTTAFGHKYDRLADGLRVLQEGGFEI